MAVWRPVVRVCTESPISCLLGVIFFVIVMHYSNYYNFFAKPSAVHLLNPSSSSSIHDKNNNEFKNLSTSSNNLRTSNGIGSNSITGSPAYDPKKSIPRYLLDRNTGARCLDGTQPAFYLRRGHNTGANRWLIFFEGGGWCYDLGKCKERSVNYLLY